MMKKGVCSLLVCYGGLAVILGFLAQKLAPDVARTTLLAGAVGGGWSALWGVLGLIGKPRRGWAIFTMAFTAFVLLTQAVTHWMPSGEPLPGSRTLAWLATLMLLATIGTLMAVAHASAPGSGTSAGGSDRPSRDSTPPGSDAPDAWREARRHRNSTSKP